MQLSVIFCTLFLSLFCCASADIICALHTKHHTATLYILPPVFAGVGLLFGKEALALPLMLTALFLCSILTYRKYTVLRQAVLLLLATQISAALSTRIWVSFVYTALGCPTLSPILLWLFSAVFAVAYAQPFALYGILYAKFPEKALPKKQFISFCFLPAGTVVAPILMNLGSPSPIPLSIFSALQQNTTMLLQLAIGMFIMINSYIAAYFAIQKSLLSEEEKLALEQLEIEIENNYRYYKFVERQALEVRRFRHDLNNLLQISQTLHTAKPEDAEEILNELHQKLDTLQEDLLKPDTNFSET